MSLKFSLPFLKNGSNLFCGVRLNVKSIFNFPVFGSFQNKVQFCSEKKNSTRETKLKELLNKSSPLQPSPEAESLWATSPYVEGTVFRESENEYSNDRLETYENKSIVLFPGQGNQFVGMANNLIKYPVVKDMFASASDVLGYDLLEVCTEGPEEKLNDTKYCQPATFVCSLAALEKIKDEKPWVLNNCVGSCGYSLGELSAIVFAGCISFEKGIELVKIRAEAMELCSKITPGGMLTVFYGPNSKLSKAIADAVQHCQLEGIKHVACSVASYLFPGCKVIAGNVEALNFIIENSKEYGLKKYSKLPVSGAFHTDLMKDAAEPFQRALDRTFLKEPVVPVYSNVKGRSYRSTIEIKTILPKQIYMPVKWEQIMHQIYQRPKGLEFPYSYECGPGNSLSVLLKKINMAAARTCFSVKL